MAHWAAPFVGMAQLCARARTSAVKHFTPVSSSGVAFGPHGPSHPNCNRWQLERWNLNGSNTITAIYNNTPFNYTVTFKQNGSCLTGTLTDPNIPSNLPQSAADIMAA